MGSHNSVKDLSYAAGILFKMYENREEIIDSFRTTASFAEGKVAGAIDSFEEAAHGFRQTIGADDWRGNGSLQDAREESEDLSIDAQKRLEIFENVGPFIAGFAAGAFIGMFLEKWYRDKLDDMLRRASKPEPRSSAVDQKMRRAMYLDGKVEKAPIDLLKAARGTFVLPDPEAGAAKLINLNDILVRGGADWYTSLKDPVDRFSVLQSLIDGRVGYFPEYGLKVKVLDPDSGTKEIFDLKTGEKITYTNSAIVPTQEQIKGVEKAMISKWAKMSEKEWKWEETPKINWEHAVYGEDNPIFKIRTAGNEAAIASVLYDAVCKPTSAESEAFLERAHLNANPFSDASKSASPTFTTITAVLHNVRTQMYLEQSKTKIEGTDHAGHKTVAVTSQNALSPVDPKTALEVKEAIKAGKVKIAKAKSKAPGEKVK